jgi:hypothetical protein
MRPSDTPRPHRAASGRAQAIFWRVLDASNAKRLSTPIWAGSDALQRTPSDAGNQLRRGQTEWLLQITGGSPACQWMRRGPTFIQSQTGNIEDGTNERVQPYHTISNVSTVDELEPDHSNPPFSPRSMRRQSAPHRGPVGLPPAVGPPAHSQGQRRPVDSRNRPIHSRLGGSQVRERCRPAPSPPS